MAGKEPLIAERKDSRKEGVALAAWKMEDALNERLVDEYPRGLEARNLHFKASAANSHFKRAMWLMLLVTVMETPTWCETDDNFLTYMEPTKRCAIPGVPQREVLLSNMPYIPPGWGVAVELFVMLLVVRKLLLERSLQVKHFSKLGPKGIDYHSLPVINFGLCMCALHLVDCVVFVHFRPNFRLAFVARTGYLCMLPAVRRLGHCISAVVGEFMSIAVFYAGTIVFFAWIAVVMFDDVKGEVNGQPVNKGFSTFRATLNTMFIAGSTDEFVDCFILTYTANRATGLLWLLFLVIVHVLLLNLVLDTLVAAYTGYQEHAEEVDSAEAVEGIREAFQNLAEEDRLAGGQPDLVTEAMFLEFITEFSRSPNVRPIPEKNADIVFRSVDKDGSGHIDEEEFFNICGIAQYDFWTTQLDSPVKRWFPGCWDSVLFKGVRAAVINGGFDQLMNLVLMVNLGLVITESVYDLNDWTETPLMENLELSFSLVYVTEVLVKLSVWDFGYYWSFYSNIFDFSTTWLLLASSVLDEMAASSDGSNLKRYMNILRLLRLLRVLKQLKRLRKVQLMVETISTIVTLSAPIMTLTGVVTYFFSTLAVQLWGGILYESNPALAESEYAEKKFWVFNFNDFLTSFGVWVVSLICEYVPVFPDAVSRASGVTGSWLVFLAFYVGGVSIVFELLKAFTIEAFVEIHKTWELPDSENEHLKAIGDTFLEQGLYFHFRIVGDPATHEKIMNALEEKCKELEEHSHGHGHGAAAGHGAAGGHGAH
mmetsp:Transcript_2025/g.5861  ORF Transcript_2025/g.5861 Transcript_2025/m.5861 type:complete len:765 (-) Transcript_2025:10-2304(-)